MTSQKRVAELIHLANIKPGQVVYDLGCGDGRICRAAAQAGAIAYGVDINGFAIWLARLKTKLRRQKNLHFIHADFMTQSYHQADVIFIYLLPPVIHRLESKLKAELPLGAKIISFQFPLPKWAADKIQNGIYIYIKK